METQYFLGIAGCLYFVSVTEEMQAIVRGKQEAAQRKMKVVVYVRSTPAKYPEILCVLQPNEHGEVDVWRLKEAENVDDNTPEKL